jgi:hypothetical protein
MNAAFKIEAPESYQVLIILVAPFQQKGIVGKPISKPLDVLM